MPVGSRSAAEAGASRIQTQSACHRPRSCDAAGLSLAPARTPRNPAKVCSRSCKVASRSDGLAAHLRRLGPLASIATIPVMVGITRCCPSEKSPRELCSYYYGEGDFKDTRWIFLFVFFDQDCHDGYVSVSRLQTAVQRGMSAECVVRVHREQEDLFVTMRPSCW